MMAYIRCFLHFPIIVLPTSLRINAFQHQLSLHLLLDIFKLRFLNILTSDYMYYHQAAAQDMYAYWGMSNISYIVSSHMKNQLTITPHPKCFIVHEHCKVLILYVLQCTIYFTIFCYIQNCDSNPFQGPVGNHSWTGTGPTVSSPVKCSHNNHFWHRFWCH